MAKRKTTRKSVQEARVERFTWFLMVVVFAVLYIFPPDQYNIPNFTVPLAGAIILLGAGIYQYTRHWRVGPVTWIAGTVMLLLALVNAYIDPDLNFYGITLLAFAAVIGMGVLTNET